MLRLNFPASFEYLEEIRSRVAETARAAGFDDRAIYAIQLAADEAASNIIEHAYRGHPEATFELTCDFEKDRLTMTFTDQGRAFDPSKVAKPDLKADLSQRKIGGLGIYLMRKLMDEVHYKSTTAGNVLTLIKYKD